MIKPRLTSSPERLNLAHVIAQTFGILRRDFLPVMALALVVSGAGIAAQGWLETAMGRDIALRQTAMLIPWLAGFIPTSLADVAIVWIALRRLGHVAPLSLRGAAIVAGVGLAVDLVENAPDIVQLLIPYRFLQDRIVADALDYYPLLLLVVGSAWLALWLPALAVAVDERVGGPTSLGRALSLTGGHRWTLFSLILALQLAVLVMVELLGVGLVRLGLGWLPSWTADIIAQPIWAMSSITQAVVYWELTRLKTGLAPAGAAAVFD